MDASWKVRWAHTVMTSHCQSLAMCHMPDYIALWKQNYGERKNRKRKR